ncbi:MAG: PASTA domain-containing protein [Pseudonocardia sp.]|nr:PASTA domain-containing protein [Pseudonocardia sp.]
MRKTALLPAFALAALALAGCGTGDSFDEGFKAGSAQTSPAPAAAPATTAPASSAPAPLTQVEIPDVEGRNAAIVSDELQKLGLTNVQFASQDEQDKMVLNRANWTVMKIEPGAGEKVASDSTIVVTATKE